eukprot:COSAG02_NODE_13477_length_1389_cov_2.460465_3_plen_59_part_00
MKDRQLPNEPCRANANLFSLKSVPHFLDLSHSERICLPMVAKALNNNTSLRLEFTLRA